MKANDWLAETIEFKRGCVSRDDRPLLADKVLISPVWDKRTSNPKSRADARTEDCKVFKVRFWGRIYVDTKNIRALLDWNCHSPDADSVITCDYDDSSAPSIDHP
jgi:hypothetical protein